MTLEPSCLGRYKNIDAAGRPIEWRGHALAAFRAFHAVRLIEEKVCRGELNASLTREEHKRVISSPEAQEHAEATVASLEAAAGSRGWEIVALPCGIIDRLPGSACTRGALQSILIGLERADGKISPVAFDAETILFQVNGGMTAPKYNGKVDFESELRALEPLGLAFI